MSNVSGKTAALGLNGKVDIFSQDNANPSPPKEISFKVKEYIPSWPQFDLAEGILAFDVAGTETPSTYKAIINTQAGFKPISIVKKDYVLLPNQEVKRIADSLTPQYGLDLYETPGASQSHYSRDGNAMFLYYFPQGEHNGSAFEREIVKGDSIKLGIALRNSIDGSVGFGCDGFSYRGLCGNGSIQQRISAMNTYHKHTSGLKDIIPTLKVMIESTLAASDVMVSFYKKLAGLTLTQEIAEAISATYIPKKYLPWDMTEPTEKDGQVIDPARPILTTLSLNESFARTSENHLDQTNLWNVYNHITGSIWHNNNSNNQSKTLVLNAFGNAISKVVQTIPVKGGA